MRAKVLVVAAALLLGVGRMVQVPLPVIPYADPLSIQVPCAMVEANGSRQAQSCLVDTGTAGDMLLSPAEAQAIGAEPVFHAATVTTVAGTMALTMDWATVDVAGARYRAEAMVFPAWTGGPVIGMRLLARMGSTMEVNFGARTVAFARPGAPTPTTAQTASTGLASWQQQWLQSHPA